MCSFLAAFVSLLSLLEAAVAATYQITVQETASHAVPETLFGLMFEDINSGDGGLYGELLQNRAFQQVTPGTSSALVAWSSIGNSSISVVDNTTPLSSALPNSLQVSFSEGSTGSVGVANSGYTGFAVIADSTYTASVNFKFASGTSYTGPLTISLVSSSGTVLASASKTVSASTSWESFSASLTPSSSAPDTNNQFEVTLDGASVGEGAGGTAYFTLASLFPPTFKGRANGMREDIAQTLADIKPAFFRFPGGNNLGQTVASRWIWNNTVGPLTERPGRLGDWGYINTDGLGLLEYIYWLEDMGMNAIMAVWSGYSLGGTIVAENELAPYIQEAIDQINFVAGDAGESAPAALRASLGHPDPFPLKYVEIGNEDFFAEPSYASYRWHDFYGNLSAAFPDIDFLATTYVNDPVLSPPAQLYDVHVYQTGTWFYQNAFYYDSFARNGMKYFEGEYAATSTTEFPLMSGSAGEAAFMTGLERNSDIVFAASYAPLLQSLDSYQWTPNLISFNAGSVLKSTSYYVQQLFGTHKGTEYIPSTLPTNGDTVHWSVVRDTSVTPNAVYIKVANAGPSAATLDFTQPFAVASQATLTVLSGSADGSNTPSDPDSIVPETSTINVGQTFSLNAPAYSVSVVNLNLIGS